MTKRAHKRPSAFSLRDDPLSVLSLGPLLRPPLLGDVFLFELFCFLFFAAEEEEEEEALLAGRPRFLGWAEVGRFFFVALFENSGPVLA